MSEVRARTPVGGGHWWPCRLRSSTVSYYNILEMTWVRHHGQPSLITQLEGGTVESLETLRAKRVCKWPPQTSTFLAVTCDLLRDDVKRDTKLDAPESSRTSRPQLSGPLARDVPRSCQVADKSHESGHIVTGERAGRQGGAVNFLDVDLTHVKRQGSEIV